MPTGEAVAGGAAGDRNGLRLRLRLRLWVTCSCAWVCRACIRGGKVLPAGRADPALPTRPADVTLGS